MSEFFLVRWRYYCQAVSFERLFLHLLSACVNKKTKLLINEKKAAISYVNYQGSKLV